MSTQTSSHMLTHMPTHMSTHRCTKRGECSYAPASIRSTCGRHFVWCPKTQAYVNTHACTHVYTHVYTHDYSDGYVYAYAWTLFVLHFYKSSCTQRHCCHVIHTRLHACLHARTHARTHVKTHACKNARMHTCMRLHTHLCAHMCMRMSIHTGALRSGTAFVQTRASQIGRVQPRRPCRAPSLTSSHGLYSYGLYS